MSSVGQSNTGGVTGNSDVTFKPVDYFDESVKRGYDQLDTESRNTAIAEGKKQASHRLDQPRAAHSASMQGMTSSIGMGMPDFANLVPKNIEGFDFKSVTTQLGGIQDSANLMQGVQQLEGVLGEKLDPGKLGDLMKVMFSPASSMSTDEAWKWAEATLDPTELKMLEQSFGREGKFSFTDAMIKLSAMSGPPELVKEIKSDVQKAAQIFMGNQLWDTDMISTMLSGIQQKMQDNRLKFDQETIKISQVEKERLSNKMISDIRESIEKTNKAKKASWINRIFGFIGLGVMAAVTIIAIATGVGAIAGALMIAAFGMMLAMTLDQELNEGKGMKAITDGVMDAFGVDEKEAMWIVSGAMMAIMIALSLGAGASGAAASGASKMGALASRGGMIISGGVAVADGGSQIAAGAYNLQASELQADAKETKAKMMRLQQMIEDATESLQQAMEDIQTGHARIAAIISNNDETKKGIMRNFK
ncbi:type III secretion system translocon subunit SctE [Endozoicomonas sp. Mp262]|uniref:type III secretion system translocon subunit SctE n=1 Tax=Endozoicomonas sp. Mp262 TaxID=2919499 RepID=UPI0021D83BC2